MCTETFASRYEWERIMRRCRMKPLTKYVGMVLAQYANTDGTNAFPSVAKLARVTCLSERSVRNALTELRALGLIKRVQKGGLRGTQAYPDVHCLVIPADLLERFELLTPGENDPTPPTPNRQEVPPGDDPNRHVVPPNRHVEVAQPADDDTPTGTTCLLPITTYLARDLDSPTDDSRFGTRPTTGEGARNDDDLLARLIQFDAEVARRRGA
jgi:hypothetical protein